MFRFVFRHPILVLLALVLLAGLSFAGRIEYWHWRAERHFRTAQLQMAEFHYEKAYDQIREAVALRPDRVDIRFFAARAARRVMDMVNAKQHLEACAKELGKADDYRLEQQLFAVQCGNAGDFAEDTLWLRLKSDSVYRALILEALLRGALETNRLPQAERAVDAWLSEPTDDARPYYFRGLINEQFGEGRKQRVVQDYELSLTKNPDYDECRLQLAEFHLKNNRAPEARPHFEELRRRLPDNPDVAVGLARCMAAVGQNDEAQRLLDEVLSKDGNHAAALRERGMLVLNQNPAEAETWLRKAYDAMPQDPTASYNFYLCLQKQGKTKEAQEQLDRHNAWEAKQERLRDLMRKALTTHSKDPEVLCEIGKLYLETNRPEFVELARRWLERALAADPNSKPTFKALADYYLRTNRPDLAEKFGEKAR